ncbi:unnamed protein product [Rotaria socialis]|uniref:Uncharacterized protein n=2 Tax=Rotaria socialis TaxID=392032 RepID=A0A821KU02_9BILA|nr:unnamed protein product [Rotaria socialis]
MKRWKQQRLQNQAIQIGQALYQHNVDEVNIDPEIDDIIDINSININNTIDDPIISNVNVSESRFLNDAIDKIKQLSCDEPNIIMEKDISCALVLLKKRHRLSARCMDDIISLLRIFNVPNVPSSWYRLKKSLTETQLTPIQSFICSECQELSTSSASCSQCNCHFSSTNKPNYIFSFPIQNQIERILHYNKDILPTRRCYAMSMTDICDGALHQKLQSRIQESFLALTLNVDRIQPNKGSQKTIWPILLVINELPLKRRFAIENIILAGVWPGPSKPSRTEMSLFFRPLVEELVTLEQGAKFQYQDDNNSSTSARIFLIGACCDKPAQALLQFLPEPIATFGCGRCEVEGRKRCLLTRITKSTRRHAQELIGNLHLIQEAYCHLNNFNFMNSNFANYLFTRFACHRKSDDSTHCQLGHLRKEDDSVVRLLFPFAHIKYYQTVHVGRIRLCTRTYAEGKVADDSNIIFIFDNVQYPDARNKTDDNGCKNVDSESNVRKSRDYNHKINQKKPTFLDFHRLLELRIDENHVNVDFYAYFFYMDTSISSMRQIEFCSNEHDQLSTSSEVNSVHKESSLNKRTAVDDSSDDNSEFESEMDENEKNNDDYVLKSNGLTSSNKKKKSSALKITKSGAAAAAKRLLLDNSIDSINIDEQQLDISQLANYMKELNVNNKHLMK